MSRLDEFVEDYLSSDDNVVKEFYELVAEESMKKAEKLALYWLQYRNINTEGFDSDDFKEYCRDREQECYYSEDDYEL